MGRIVGFEPTHDGATIRCVNHFTIFAMLSMAGAVGIEPTLTVLETGVLPLYDAPNWFLYYYTKKKDFVQAIKSKKSKAYFYRPFGDEKFWKVYFVV